MKKQDETMIIFILIITIFIVLHIITIFSYKENTEALEIETFEPNITPMDYIPYDKVEEFYAPISDNDSSVLISDYCVDEGETPITHMNKDKITFKENTERIQKEYVEKYGELKLDKNGLWYYDVSIYGGVNGATIPYYLVAMGSYYNMGERYAVELDYEEYVYVVKVEEKSDIHTINRCQHKEDNSVVEVLTDGRNPELLNITHIWK